jgi:hypothetical protein
MNLEKNYQLLDVVRDDGIRTMRAREMASGRALEIHLFMRQEDHALFERLQGLPLSGRRQLLECGSELTIPYIVTDPVAGETNARAWFTTLVTPTQNVPQAIKASVWKTGTPLPDPLFPHVVEAAPVKPAPGNEPGEFTRMFQVPAPAAAEPEPVKAAVEEPGEFTRMFRAAPEVPKPAELDAGEFTRMFQAPEANPAPPPKEEPGIVTRTMQVPVVAPLETPQATPPPDDGATRLFQVPVAAQAAPEPPAKEAGEFTRLFQSMQQNPAAKPEAAKATGPGEFTRMFQSPLSPGVQNPNARAEAFPVAPAPPPPPQNRGGEFTQLFGTPSAGAPVKAAPPLGGGFGQSATGAFAAPQAPPQQYRAPQGQGQGPGQFTQMMSAGSAPTLGQQPPQQQGAGMKAKNSNMPLIVILGSLALFAVLIVVFFAMRR